MPLYFSKYFLPRPIHHNNDKMKLLRQIYELGKARKGMRCGHWPWKVHITMCNCPTARAPKQGPSLGCA